MPKAKAPRQPVPLERDVQAQMRAWLVAHGCVVHRRSVAGARKMPDGSVMTLGQTGQADLWGKLPDGRHFELEVKRPGNRPTQAQVDWLTAMNGRGRDRSVAFWADSLADVEQVFRRVMDGWRVVYDHNPRPGDYRLEAPTRDAP